MALILSIEASTKCGSVALLEGTSVIGTQYYNIDKSHSSLLHLMIEQLMNNAGCELKELDAVAVAEGPGSYTGLRIAASTVKGLCYSLDIPLIAVNTLSAMAKQVSVYHRASKHYYCPMIDARRMEVYAEILDVDLNIVSETSPVIVDEKSYTTLLEQQTVLFFGDGAGKCKEVIDHPNAIFLENIVPQASDVGLLAIEKFKKAEFENVISFEPFYLKEYRIIPSKK